MDGALREHEPVTSTAILGEVSFGREPNDYDSR